MLAPIILPTLSRILNYYLKLDPEMQQRLTRYKGRVIRFTISTIDSTFYISIEEKGLELKPKYGGVIDASIKASLSDLAKNAFNDKARISETMELNGDTAMLQTVTNIFRQVEIDWEELMSNYTGDIVAHSIGNLVRDVKSFHEELFETGQLNTKEYLQEEIKLLTHPFAVDDFCKDVDEFRDQVERADARINLIRQDSEEN